MTRSSPISLLFVTLSIACATSPAATPSRPEPAAPVMSQAAPPPPPVAAPTGVNPVGTFDFTAIGPDGSSSNGTFTISGTPGAYVGRVEREGMGGTELTSIVVEGQTMKLSAAIPEGVVELTLNFTGNNFNGKWAIQGTEGGISGKRR